MGTKAGVVILVVATVVTTPVIANDCLEVISREPIGRAYSAAAGDGLAGFGSGAGFVVADITDPSAPVELSRIGLPEPVYGTAYLNGHFFAVGSAGLQVIDASNPASAAVVGSYDNGYFIDDVEVHGGLLYLLSSDAGLVIVDISDPSQPAAIGSFDTAGRAYGVAFAAAHAFVADGSEGLTILDTSDPSNPAFVGSVDTTGNADGVAVNGDYAYLADGQAGLQVVDVTTPGSPTLGATIPTGGFYAYDVVVSAGRAYVADVGGGLIVFDLADPGNPTAAGVFTGVAPTDVMVDGNTAYVADYAFHIVDVTDPANMVELSSMSSTFRSANAVAATAGTAFLAVGTEFQVIDVSDPMAPVDGVALPVLSSGGSRRGMTLSDEHVYVAQTTSMRIIDVTNPAAPVDLGTPGGFAADIAVQGDFAYVAAATNVKVLDVTDPGAPFEVGSLTMPDLAWGIAVAGSRAYVAARDAGLRILDVSNPATPIEIGSLDGTGTITGVAVSGGHAFLADDDYGMRVVDVSNPTAPVEVALVPALGDKIEVAHGTAYLTDSNGDSPSAWDVSTPEQPTLIRYGSTVGLAYGSAVVGDLLFVADGSCGLVIHSICNEIFRDSFESGDTSGWSTHLP